ncbi:MAG: DUF1566 domain-containing protein [Nitrospirae bacterium]|nr:DUF1566 domain-containing protein [Nitrospirota bacterium]
MCKNWKQIFLAVVLTVFLPVLAFAVAVDLPQTGQTKCYDTYGTEISCAGTGQDGDIQAGVAWPEPRFTVGTGVEADCVTDNLTGLMWPKNGNLAGITNWNTTINYANNLTLCGYSDWRLPNVNELESLVNAGESDIGTWLNTQGFYNVQSGFYWSSTTYAYSTNFAWFVVMWNGYAYFYDKDYYYFVLPVRSTTTPPAAELWKTGQTISYITGDDGDLEMGAAWTEPRFTVGIGVKADCVTDNLTGLMWTKNANLAGYKTWQKVIDYANNLTLCGYSDWRLPNRKELMSLIDRSKYGPALPTGHPFTNVRSLGYWSSTTYAFNTGYAWFVNMWNGYVDYNFKDFNGFVWPVRSGQLRSFDYYCDDDNDWYVDSSIDGTCTGSGCVPSDCQTSPGDDCDDGDSAINPEADDSQCDGIDNDCDGDADEDYVPTSTTCGVGACQSTGELICQNGQTIDTCTAGTPGTEGPYGDPTCSDTIDNDCDGSTDAADSNCQSPDLVISDLLAPLTARAGKTVTVYERTKNNGTGIAGDSTTKFYLSTDNRYNPGYIYLGMRVVSSLTGGALNKGRTQITIPSGTIPGNYYIIGRADAGGVAAESNEKNNTKAIAITITSP